MRAVGADDTIYALCDIVCERIARQLEGKAQERDIFLRASGGRETSKGGAGSVRPARRRA
jgi:hypothetical protein